MLSVSVLVLEIKTFFPRKKFPLITYFWEKSLQMLQNEQKIYMYVLLLLRLCSMMKATDSDRLAIGKNGHGINRIIG